MTSFLHKKPQKTYSEEEKKTLRDEWFKTNQPTGKRLGYPDCCIQAFCDQPPQLMTGKPTLADLLRYEAACIDGEFTGFVPCLEHAQKIVSGEITLASLIKDRDENFDVFPNA